MHFYIYRFCVATTTYGIGFNISGFGLNMYLTQFVYGAIEIPAKLSMYYLLEKIGRRRTETGALLFAGITLMVNIFIPRGETNAMANNVNLYIFTLNGKYSFAITTYICFI